MNALRYHSTGETDCVGVDHLHFEHTGVVSDRDVGQPYGCHMREEKLYGGPIIQSDEEPTSCGQVRPWPSRNICASCFHML